MVMQATWLAGVDAGGYPPQPDAAAIVRSVDNELIEAMDLSVPLLTLVGGLSGFNGMSTKFEWLNGDNWRRRLSSHGGLAAAGTTTLTVTAQASRYPVGTIFRFEDELVRVTSIIDADTLGIARAQQGTTAAIHASTVVAGVAGSSMHEGDNWVYRPHPTISVPYNYFQMDHTALRNTWRRQAVNFYGINGSEELDRHTADTLAQKTVAIEAALIHGQRHVGLSTSPASSGGLNYFITSANGADVVDKLGAALTWADFYGMISRIADNVGDENVAGTIIAEGWAREKINGFFAGARRMTTSEKVGGSVIEKLIIEGKEINLITVRSMSGVANLYFINTANVKVGHLGAAGLLHVGEVMQNDGPFSGRYVYADFGFKIKNIPTMGRIYNYSLTT